MTRRGALLAAALALAGAGPADAAVQTITLTITARAATAAPYFIAIAKGYYAEQGLAVTIVDAGGGVATPALIAGSVDFTMSAAVAVGAVLRGAPLRVIYTMADRPPYVLWSTRPELTTLADLKGRQVGIVSRGDTFELAMRMTLQAAGLPANFVGYTALGPGTAARQAAIASGALPAVILGTGDVEPLRLSPAFARMHLILDMSKTIRLPYTGVATSARLIATRPEIVTGFLRAMVRGVRFMRQYKDATVAILAQADKQADRRALAADYDALIPTLTADGTAPPALIRQDLLARAALLDVPARKIPAADAVYDYVPLRAVNAELAASGWTPTP